jgi:hypothetical protein
MNGPIQTGHSQGNHHRHDGSLRLCRNGKKVSAAHASSGRCVGQSWIAARLTEARTVIAEASAHSDHLLRLACQVVISHAEGDTERAGARALLFAVDVRSPVRLQIGAAGSAQLRGRT